MQSRNFALEHAFNENKICVQLSDDIKKVTINQNFGEKKTVTLEYAINDIINKFKPARPCIKRYLFSQVQGKGLYGISGEDWSYAAAMPLHKFQKESAKYVWGQSKKYY